MVKNLISVVVPVYNVENYLERCVESIIEQTYKQVEIILINDGSTDSCPVICDALANKYKTITVLHKQNGGLSDARNKGIEISKGEYIAFIDSDDYIYPRYLEVLLRAVQRDKTDISCCQYQEVTGMERCNTQINTDKLLSKRVDGLWCMNRLLEKQSFTSAWAKLFKKNIFDKHVFPYGLLYEDMFIMPIIFEQFPAISFVDAPMYFYNQDGFSITRSFYSKIKIEHFFNATNSWHKRVLKTYPQLKSKSEAKLIGDYLQLYAYSMQLEWNAEELFFSSLKSMILKTGMRGLMNRHTRNNDKVKLFAFYLGFLNYLVRFKTYLTHEEKQI